MSCPISAFELFFELAKLCLVDLDAGAHRGSDDAALDILTLSCSGLCLDDRAEESVEVLLELVCAKGSLSDGAVNDVGLVQTILNLTGFDIGNCTG